jgi:hypothetical protein
MPFMGSRGFPGDLFIPGVINEAVARVKNERRDLMIRRAQNGTYRMLIQAPEEIDPLEDERFRPVLYATVEWAGRYVVVNYVDGRRELI